MTDENNGENSSQEYVSSKLAAIEAGAFLKDFTVSQDYEKFLDLTSDDIKMMNAEACDEGAYLLTQASTYLQRKISINNASIYWLNENIRFLVGSNYPDKIKQSKEAMRMQKVKVDVETFNISIYETVDRLDKLAKTLSNLAFRKSKLNG